MSSTVRGAREFIEGQVHRWAGAVSGQPGGYPLRDPGSAHRPEPVEHPGLVVVGDYSVRFDPERRASLRPTSRPTAPHSSDASRRHSIACASAEAL